MNESRPFVRPIPKPEWQPLKRDGAVGVEFRVLAERQGLVLASLRFAPHATIDEHSASFEIDVVCLSGEGFVSIGHEHARFRRGETVTWPARAGHRLWTQGSPMETLMIERREP
jgi:quercetin dioxygenase-like cupin family protein